MGTLKSRQDNETLKGRYTQKAELLGCFAYCKNIQGLSVVARESRWYLTVLFNDFKNTTSVIPCDLVLLFRSQEKKS